MFAMSFHNALRRNRQFPIFNPRKHIQLTRQTPIHAFLAMLPGHLSGFRSAWQPAQGSVPGRRLLIPLSDLCTIIHCRIAEDQPRKLPTNDPRV